jgi:hypothetical protein
MVSDIAAVAPKNDAVERAVDRRLSAATLAGRARSERGDLAVSARFDSRAKRLDIELASGVRVSIPVVKLEGLAGAPASVISTVRIDGGGYGLHWPSLDLDLAVPGLIAGCFGSSAWMSALGRRGGKATSKAKRQAARENGKKGGRPRKVLADVDVGTR